jgi:NAD(P)-dependent dehydrogenase (short-subunit alcohol dehydrogenase family)
VDLDLKGKTVLVTGASRGIGKNIARAFYSENCKIAINSRNIDDLKKVASELPGVVIIPADVTKPDQAKQMIMKAIEALGGLDILVCNVGSGSSVSPGDEYYQEWKRVFATNLWSTTNTVEAARESLSKRRGVIVCISSICGIEVVPKAPVTYSVAKSALNAYVRGISRPLGKNGVRINAIAAGNILFDKSVWGEKLKDSPESVQEMLKHNVSLSSLGTLNNITDLVMFLASNRASFATGSIWTLDGGQVHS